ncbi:Naphthalene 1,2-dioxygenase system ferredoxin--NAD(+) reductase component [Luteitalea pratensis]|uniref:Naphthalene 1,2-dioxygenase system ferredoxin--NAD(+) reductase component n=1 Tax=Luteitalea pratensis TaxID=1855912 RepID=A0A143PIG4_LUTPR|nr:FAD-binding oxidoreductase [Luteitalea pratensis]AMY07564.1 Naphthalene 1,2-dioxygenase system ferredoxin--NAD(+) reductase component [Luteitalea pratensis]
MPDALTLTVRELAAPTPTTRRLLLALGDVPFSYQAGQGGALGLHGQRERRPYSIASAPADSSADGTIEFLLRALPGGGLGRHLDGVREGTRVDFEGPFGAFVLPDDLPDAPLLFVAGGTGFAPLRSLAREARARGHRAPRHLLYSVKDVMDVAYAEELARWGEDHRGEAVITATRHAPPTWQGSRGRIGLTLLRRFTSDAPLCFVCGPAGMVEDLTHTLSQLGVPAGHVRMEQWAPTM